MCVYSVLGRKTDPFIIIIPITIYLHIMLTPTTGFVQYEFIHIIYSKNINTVLIIYLIFTIPVRIYFTLKLDVLIRARDQKWTVYTELINIIV